MNKFAGFLKTSLLDPLIRSFFRFTDAIAWSVILVILSIINLEIEFLNFPFDEMVRVCWLILPYLIFKTLLLERVKMAKYWTYVMTLAVLGLGVAYFFLRNLSPNIGIEMTRHATLWIIGILASLTISYFPKRENFSTYIIFLASKFFTTAFYSAVLYGGLTAVFFSIESLFNVIMPNFFYMEMLLAIIGLVAVPVGLGFIPKMETELGIDQYNKIWKTVFSFIVLPITTIFSVILLVYVITSTFNANYYPYVYMICSLGSAAIGLLTLFVLEPFKKDMPHIHLFSRWWPFLILAILAGFYVELIRSIIQDGLTLDNSMYLYASLWALSCTLLYVIKKFPFKMQTGQSFASLLVTTLVVAMFVPWINFVSLTTYSLNRRFERFLTTYGMLENGEIVHPDLPLSDTQKVTLSNLVIAFSQIGYERIELLPEDFVFDNFETVFGFVPSGYIENPEYIDLYYYTENFVDLSVILEGDYDVLLSFESYVGHSLVTDDYALLGDQAGDTWQLTINDPLTIISLPIADMVKGFYEELGTNTASDLPIETLSYEGVAASYSYRIFFTHIAATYQSSIDSVSVGSFRAYIGILIP